MIYTPTYFTQEELRLGQKQKKMSETEIELHKKEQKQTEMQHKYINCEKILET